MAKDPELALQLQRAPNARERGRLLGIDYDAVVATNWRVTAGAVAIGFAFTAVFLGVAFVLVASTHGGETLVIPVSSWIMGLIASFAASLIGLVACSLAIQALQRTKLSPVRQQLLADPLNPVFGAVAILTFLTTLPPDSFGALVLGYALSSAALSLLGVQQLPLAILINDRNLQTVASVTRTVPAAFTLLGGKSRWILICFAITLVEATGVALLLASAPLSAFVALPLRAAVSAAVIYLHLTRGPRAGVLVAGAAAIAFFVAGFAAA